MIAPPRVHRPRVYYGWYVLAVAMLGSFLAAGTSQLLMSAMVRPLSDELGTSRSAVTAAISLGTILAGFLSPIIGRLADRYGPRPLMTLGALLLVGTYFGIAAVGELWQFYVVYVLGRGLTGSLVMSVVPQTAATNWFRRMRGRALGLLAMSTPLGGSTLAFIAAFLADGPGWRIAYVIFGTAVALLLVPLAALVLRRRPEDLGLLPDGAVVPATRAAGDASHGQSVEFGWTLGEALRTPALWLLIVGSILAAMANTAVGFQMVSYFVDVGIPTTAAVSALGVYALSGALASGLWGWLTERFSERGLAIGGMIACAVVTLYLLGVRDVPHAFVFAILFGFSSRGGSTLVNLILAHYYGRDSFGAISGFMMPFVMVGLGGGPSIGAVCYDLIGSYEIVFVVFAAVSLVVALLLWFARKPALPARATPARQHAE